MTYKLFRVDGTLPKNFQETLAQRLPKFAFREINPKVNPEESVGWVNILNPLDAHMTLEKMLYGKHILLGLRRDRKNLSSAIFKARLSEAMKAALRERRGKKMSREESFKVKEMVKEQMLASVSAQTALFEMAWNYESREVYFSSHTQKAAVLFADLFQETFELTLFEANVATRAEHFIEREKLDADLSTLEATAFVA
ncbi:MAG: recombination-associated protein RdgC [Candidatus Sumerlaeaceae bacterium]|nr:recombination-associated protein RdgC [Candidatus Sumerlaeaceae bacterium]